MNKFHTILLDQASRTVLKNLSTFVKEDINNVKDYKNHFSKVSESLDNALLKNSQVIKFILDFEIVQIIITNEPINCLG